MEIEKRQRRVKTILKNKSTTELTLYDFKA